MLSPFATLLYPVFGPAVTYEGLYVEFSVLSYLRKCVSDQAFSTNVDWVRSKWEATISEVRQGANLLF